MKKIDLHIHTVATISDSGFDFSLDAFKRYVKEGRLDAVAVTNHDVFDGAQFRQIAKALEATVFPGIEINVDKGHVLIIASPSDLADFEAKTSLVAKRITKIGDSITVEQLSAIFGDLQNYLVIPHYDKAPPIVGDTLEKLKPYIAAGEVDSAKKFVRAIKDTAKLTPVLFSDARMRVDLDRLPTRQTFIDCGTVSLAAIKACLRDKSKVALSEEDGNRLFQVFPDGQKLSTGLNVLIGARSSGKTHTLDGISVIIRNMKYIRQFALVQQDETKFNEAVERERSVFADNYLSGLKTVLDDVMKVDLTANDRAVEKYISTLLKSAAEIDRRDAFSKAALFDEVNFPLDQTETLSDLISSVRQVIENEEFRSIVERHIQLAPLKRLARELIELLWDRTFENKKKTFVNGLMKDIKQGLKVRTAAIPIEDADLYEISMDAKRVHRFTEIVRFLKRESVVNIDNIQAFRIEAKKEPFRGAGEVKSASGTKASVSQAFNKYGNPYEYLRELLSNDGLTPSELYKLFVKISYRILNKDGFEVSGGERSEFRLLHEISDAQNYDILLIDEPESSFDNLFLNSDVNQLIKAISAVMPVVVVTHNSTVGASIGADYLLHTTKELESGQPIYRIYSGYPSDKRLISLDGKFINTRDVLMDSLEAGVAAYNNRSQGYENLKN